MEQGFDGWIKERFHPESSDIPDIASHIDPNCFKAEWSLPGEVDDLFSWLASTQAVNMLTQRPTGATATNMSAQTAAAPAAPAAASGLGSAEQHNSVATWQLAYLQQAVQQPAAIPGQQHVPAAQQQQQQHQMQPAPMYPPPAGWLAGFDHAAAAGAGAGGGAAIPALGSVLQPGLSTVDLAWPNQHNISAQPAAAFLAPQAFAGMAMQPMQQDAAQAFAGMAMQQDDADSNQHSSRNRSNSGGGSTKQQGTSRATAKKAAGKKPRKVTDAQRAAHKRFRQRRKQQITTMAAEVVAKQAQLDALTAEHEALTAKARTLDQLVASAGDSMLLLQQMEALSLQQQEQQQHRLSPAAAGCSSVPNTPGNGADGGGPSRTLAAQQDMQQLAAAATAAGSTDGSNPPEQASACAADNSSANSLITLTADGASGGASAAAAAGGGSAAEFLDTSSGSNGGCGGSNGSTPPTPTAASLSLERLEAAVRAALGRPALPPFQQQQQQQLMQQLQLQQQQQQCLPGMAPSQSLLLQSTLPSLQGLLKSLINEVMQLVLQVNREQAEANTAATTAAAAAASTAAQGGRTAAAAAAAAAAVAALTGAAGGDQQVSSAADRLQAIRARVFCEFRAFAATNRISIYLLYTLNLETGVMGVHPPAGHWRPGAQLLLQRLDPQTLQDMVMAHRLFVEALSKVAAQRHALLMQLHAALQDSTSSSSRRYLSDSLYSGNLVGSRCAAALLLNAVDSNLRKEHVLEGVFQWTLNKLLPPLLATELVVHSYPYLTDPHAIVGELLTMLPPTQQHNAAAVAAVAAAQPPHEQQQMLLAAAEQQQQQQQQQDAYAVQYLQQAGYQYGRLQLEQQQQNVQVLLEPQQQQALLLQQQQQQQQLDPRQVSTGFLQASAPLGQLAFLTTPCGC